MDGEAASILRGELLDICISTTFLVLGFASCAIAVLRRKSGVRIFVWIGIWSATYGLMHLLRVPSVETALPPQMRGAAALTVTVILYSTFVISSFAWLELTVGAMRRIVIVLMILSSFTGVLGIGSYIVTGVSDRFLTLNNIASTPILLLLLVTVSRKTLFKKYLLLPSRGFLLFGMAVFAGETLFVNYGARVLGYSQPPIVDHVAFMTLLVAFGYSALKMVLINEHRLLEVQTELEVARQIQRSILPTEVPDVRGLRIAVAYEPMTSLAGDFYEFVPVDRDQAGFLVADVCGHGVPAALIASMLKVAVQSVAEYAYDPGQFLGALNRTLAEPLRGQLVSASYLLIDVPTRTGLYSAAGHPPALHWNGALHAIESNGLLFGILPEVQYSVRRLALNSGDRLVLYTDGITEPENAQGQPFGDSELPRILCEHHASTPDDVAHNITTKIHEWRRTPELQDDITLIVIDVE